MKTKQLKLWEGQFGNDYRERNIITEEDILQREAMWSNTISNSNYERSKLRSESNILEVGCGQGINIIAFANIQKKLSGGEINFTGIEPNKKTLEVCKYNCNARGYYPKLIDAHASNMNMVADYSQDVVLTSGVLIHIHPSDQLAAMKEIYRKSRQLIICAEYFAPTLEEVNYHGEQAMWKRDYGSLWLDNFPLRVCSCNFIWKRITGIDNLTVWIFEKTM